MKKSFFTDSVSTILQLVVAFRICIIETKVVETVCLHYVLNDFTWNGDIAGARSGALNKSINQ